MADNSYRVETVDGCTLIFGKVPMNQLVALTKSAGDAVMSTDLAHLAKASFAFGSIEDVDALTAKLRAKRLAEPVPPELSALSEPARKWLLTGHLGLSSCTMFAACTGFIPDYLSERVAPKHYPYDPDDFGRCQKLIEAVPEVEEAYRLVMPKVSPVWAEMIARWPAIVAALDDPSMRRPPRKVGSPDAYGLICDAIEAGEKNASMLRQRS